MADITDYPIAAARALQPWIGRTGEGFTQAKPNPEHYILRYVSTYHNKFSFVIVKYQGIEKNEPFFNIRYAPHTETSNSVKEFSVEPERLEQHFKNWLQLASAYKEFKNPYQSLDDKLLQESAKEIYSLFELVDEDATTATYDLKTQLLIDSVTVQIIDSITHSDLTEDDKAEIVEELEELRETQGGKTKGEVAGTISRSLAKVKKFSFSLFKKVIETIVIELTKKAIESNFIQGLISLLPGLPPDK